jgi:CheY-like chemotaxis protein
VDNRRCILIVDDTPLFRDLESLFLARTGRVVTARDADEGLAALRRERPDIAVIDLHMPGQSGDEMCRTIKADPELRSMPVILVMGSDRPEDHARAIRAGADDVLASRSAASP